MPDTVNDFMSRFGGDKTLDEREASQYQDRFVSTHPDDAQFDSRAYHEGATEYLGQLPDAQFDSAARRAVAAAPPEERKGLLGGIMNALGGGGGGLGSIASMLGLGSTDPATMNDDDAARVINYARKERPDVLRQTVEKKPWFVKALGSPVVMGVLAAAATKIFNNQRR